MKVRGFDPLLIEKFVSLPQRTAIMEFMLQYTWLHRMLPLGEVRTTDGSLVEVINPGIQNGDAGPDFIGAHVKIDGVDWNGNVEIHMRSSEWYAHGHDNDPAYDNVILHVVSDVDCKVETSNGHCIPQLELHVPETVVLNYGRLIASDKVPRCRNILKAVPRLTITSWFSSLYVERLEQRTKQILERKRQCDGNWEATAFVTICRNFGFGKNGDAFEHWARLIPMSVIGKHRDSLFQIEAIFFGVAGLLTSTPTDRHPDYYRRLWSEYRYLRQKFSLQSMNVSEWKFLRLRPYNFPFIRIAQLSVLYCSGRLNLSKVTNSRDMKALYDLLDTHVSDFWKTHYSFLSGKSPMSDKSLTRKSKDLIVINSLVPLMFAYGRYRSDSNLCDKAISWLEELKPERNCIVDQWRDSGVECKSASESQAIIQLTQRYCVPKDCIHCRFGHEYISMNPYYLQEGKE